MEFIQTCPNDKCQRQMKEISRKNGIVEFICPDPRCRSHKVSAIWGLIEEANKKEWALKEGRILA
jgi:hypothetical protein